MEHFSPLLFLLYLVHGGLVLGGIVYILRHPREPRAMLAWILGFFLLPEATWAVFFLIGDPRIERVRRRRHSHRQRLSNLSDHLENLRGIYTAFAEPDLPPNLAGFVATATRAGRQPPTRGNKVSLCHDGQQTFAGLLQAIASAQSHIHLEYYVVRPDHSGLRLRDALAEKAAQGVECRLLVDYVGCWDWPAEFTRSFAPLGIRLAFFLPLTPWRRWRLNLRNHRKIAVIDGKIGFTGSQNIGDEYLGLDKSYAQWRDTHLHLTGPAVHELQEVFVEDWHYATHEDLSGDEYFPPPDCQDGQIVQVIPSGPDSDTWIMHHLLLGVISSAKFNICIATPYFVPDAAMLLSLQAAAYRGVQVQLLIPSCSDQRLVLWAGRSYYAELCQAGVDIYEYHEGMLHSKVVVIDEAWALVGSANMDERSFRLNFEITTLLYDLALAHQLYADFVALRSRASLQRNPRWPFAQSLLLGMARLASPLL